MKFVGLIMAFLIIIVMVFLSISFIASQPQPDPVNQTAAYNQYQNQSKVVETAYAGIDGGILLLILAFILAAMFMLFRVIK